MKTASIIDRVWLEGSTLTRAEYESIRDEWQAEHPGQNPEDFPAIEMALGNVGRLQEWKDAGSPAYADFRKWYQRPATV